MNESDEEKLLISMLNFDSKVNIVQGKEKNGNLTKSNKNDP